MYVMYLTLNTVWRIHVTWSFKKETQHFCPRAIMHKTCSTLVSQSMRGNVRKKWRPKDWFSFRSFCKEQNLWSHHEASMDHKDRRKEMCVPFKIFYRIFFLNFWGSSRCFLKVNARPVFVFFRVSELFHGGHFSFLSHKLWPQLKQWEL